MRSSMCMPRVHGVGGQRKDASTGRRRVEESSTVLRAQRQRSRVSVTRSLGRDWVLSPWLPQTTASGTDSSRKSAQSLIVRPLAGEVR